MKQKLQDVTFLLPVRIDSINRLENTLAVIDHILSKFDVSIILLNADVYDNHLLGNAVKQRVRYIFVEDYDDVFYRTYYINEMVRMANTPYIAVWDVDVLVPYLQIEESLKMLRNGYDVIYPYRYFMDTSLLLRELYFKTKNLDVLVSNTNKMKMLYGANAKGGAFFVNKNSYLEAGLENEKFYGWGLEDGERYYRWQKFEYKIHICEGYLYHLSHSRGMNSKMNGDNQRKNKEYELLKTFSSSREELLTC